MANWPLWGSDSHDTGGGGRPAGCETGLGLLSSISRPMACELELDNVARLANVISQRVEKMVKLSAWPNAVQQAGERSRMVFYLARWQSLASGLAMVYLC
jgi:hypothetical protein